MLVPISPLLAGALRQGPSTCHLGQLAVLRVAADDRHTDHPHPRLCQHLWLPGEPEGHGDGHHTRRPGHQFAGPVRLPPSVVQEKYADNSIGNVTGSNSVNVFMGLGVSWVIASIYWSAEVFFYLFFYTLYYQPTTS